MNVKLPGPRLRHQRALENYSREAQRIVELDQLAFHLNELAVAALQASAASLMLPAYPSGNFVIVSSIGSSSTSDRLCLDDNDLLIRWLKQNDDIIRFSDLDIIPQLQALPNREKEELSRIGAELFVPLKNQGKLAGILILGPKHHGRSYSKENIKYLKKLSPQIAKGLDNACLYNEIRERAGQLSLIAELGKVIASSLDYHTVFKAYINELKKFIDVDISAILSIEEEELKVLTILTELETPWKAGETFPINGNGNATAWLSNNKKVIVETDLDQQSKFSIGDMLLQYKIRSAVYVPLLYRGEFLGIFIVGSLHPGAYREKDLIILEQLSSYLVIAMENSRLYNVEKEQRAKLEALDQQRNEFLSAVSHELKTPITSLKVSTQILAKEHDITQSELGPELMENIHYSVERMERRVSELLDFLQLQEAALELNPEPLDIAGVFEEAIALITPLTLDKKQSLTMDVPPSLPAVNLDKRRLEQILLNLLSNANKYTPGEGQIKLIAKMDGSKLLVQIIDTGYGIPLNEQSLIFKPFYYSKSRKDEPSLGIGLAITKSLVELQGGTIWVESQPNKGSTFSFVLPLDTSDSNPNN